MTDQAAACQKKPNLSPLSSAADSRDLQTVSEWNSGQINVVWSENIVRPNCLPHPEHSICCFRNLNNITVHNF